MEGECLLLQKSPEQLPEAPGAGCCCEIWTTVLRDTVHAETRSVAVTKYATVLQSAVLCRIEVHLAQALLSSRRPILAVFKRYCTPQATCGGIIFNNELPLATTGRAQVILAFSNRQP